ncbi:proline-rich protein 36-like [Etheostoma spectabile]|uniref:proline-rich protein 36-like n=1 Tax=Etheostoma spectabile TaxID=54343 RepID=UPI0013AF03FA|nr:proline-rich protein 36-like [Etheostoma spectabile]XP_032393769.1 proline-rich protein 36-like [Etheostoma spectabile]
MCSVSPLPLHTPDTQPDNTFACCPHLALLSPAPSPPPCPRRAIGPHAAPPAGFPLLRAPPGSSSTGPHVCPFCRFSAFLFLLPFLPLAAPPPCCRAPSPGFPRSPAPPFSRLSPPSRLPSSALSASFPLAVPALSPPLWLFPPLPDYLCHPPAIPLNQEHPSSSPRLDTPPLSQSFAGADLIAHLSLSTPWPRWARLERQNVKQDSVVLQPPPLLRAAQASLSAPPVGLFVVGVVWATPSYLVLRLFVAPPPGASSICVPTYLLYGPSVKPRPLSSRGSPRQASLSPHTHRTDYARPTTLPASHTKTHYKTPKPPLRHPHPDLNFVPPAAHELRRGIPLNQHLVPPLVLHHHPAPRLTSPPQRRFGLTTTITSSHRPPTTPLPPHILASPARLCSRPRSFGALSHRGLERDTAPPGGSDCVDKTQPHRCDTYGTISVSTEGTRST